MEGDERAAEGKEVERMKLDVREADLFVEERERGNKSWSRNDGEKISDVEIWAVDGTLTILYELRKVGERKRSIKNGCDSMEERMEQIVST